FNLHIFNIPYLAILKIWFQSIDNSYLILFGQFFHSLQIHWNRGWGAGGSVGKRSLFLPTNTFHEQKKSECSSQIFKFVSSLAKQIEREIENILICETEARLTLLEEVSSSELDEGESQISKIRPLWRTSKKVSDDKEQ
ncbi:hypothetical protein Avbf_18576, partial [Armadillidium vulgare]